MRKEKFYITGMTCAACSSGIEKNVKKINGVQSVNVSLMGETMIVEYNENIVTVDAIVQTVTVLGYGISVFKENFPNIKKTQTDILK